MILNLIWGFCMALADSVPGVSGGTIAFLLGFYDEFINSLNYLIKGTKKERITSLKFLVKLGIGWLIGMILSVSILANVFDSGIYKVSSLFLGFVITSIPIMFIEEKESFKNNNTVNSIRKTLTYLLFGQGEYEERIFNCVSNSKLV